MLLADQTALVTGSSRGIGRAIAVAYAREGARVAIHGRTADELEKTRAAIDAVGGRCVPILADLGEPGAADAVFEGARQALGVLDILVNNAGMGSSASLRPVVDYDDAFWERTLYVNLTVPYRLTKLVLPDMLARRYGRIINVSSINGRVPALHAAAYVASKHGLLGLTRVTALEVAQDGVTVNAICPGPVRTAMNNARVAYDAGRLGKAQDEYEAGMTPLGRRLDADEIAPLAVFLASRGAAVITGQSYDIDGGVVMA
ncbi:MAG: SDR family NAD(P)-dependent oxidoreductase [Anaerolineae bacterium]